MAKLCYFYGISPREYRELDTVTEGKLWMAITRIEAQEMIRLSQLHLLADMKPQSRQKLHRQWHDLAYPMEERLKTRGLSFSDLKSVLGGKNG